ncbi:MAG: hypothetical protein Q8Q76_09250 [Methylotenera sp.]|nr:hypothetical protein [Methylotenera sp.]
MKKKDLVTSADKKWKKALDYGLLFNPDFPLGLGMVTPHSLMDFLCKFYGQ